jgi:hypothetical protein
MDPDALILEGEYEILILFILVKLIIKTPFSSKIDYALGLDLVTFYS